MGPESGKTDEGGRVCRIGEENYVDCRTMINIDPEGVREKDVPG